MSLDMTRKNSSKSERFDGKDETILSVATELDEYPQLAVIQRDFYKDTRIYPDISRALAFELRAVAELPQLAGARTRCIQLAKYFEEAYETNELIYCAGD